MSGNAMEEGLIAQIHNPSHTDPARTGFLGGAVLGFVAAAGASNILATTTFGFVFLWMFVGLFSGVWFTRRLNARIAHAREKSLIEARADQQAETARQIVEMKRKG
jgi:preprotein translocase subunit SecG